MANYLQLVNNVLVRLRQAPVSTVTTTDYTGLIARYVNDAKRDIEDAWNWNALKSTITETTAADSFQYVLTGAGQRYKILQVFNDSRDTEMRMAPTTAMTKWFLTATPQRGIPMYYNINGVDPLGDPNVDVYPVPNGAYDLRFNLIIPQDDLLADTDVPLVPSYLIEQGALVYALYERGEDSAAREQQHYVGMLGTAIAQEEARELGSTDWVAT